MTSPEPDRDQDGLSESLATFVKDDMDSVLSPALRRNMLAILPPVKMESGRIPRVPLGATVLKTYGTLTKAGDSDYAMRLHVEVRSVAHGGTLKGLIEFTLVPFLRAGMERAFGG